MMETMDKFSFLAVVVLVAFAAAFVIGLLRKWGIAEWVIVHGDDIMSKMFSCDFCLSFWTCTVLMVVPACWYDEPLLVLCGLFASPLTRRLL